MAQARERKRSKGKQRKEGERVERLHEYLTTYGSAPATQAEGAAALDAQLKSITTAVAVAIGESSTGTVVDVGCGSGILLSRLAELEVFVQQTLWLYAGIDHPTAVDEVLVLAAKRRLHRRVDAVTLEEFYQHGLVKWDWPKPVVVVIRNVLHELGISDTARLFATLTADMTPADRLFIQDLTVFPQAERGNACWIPSVLGKVLPELGFDYTLTEEPTRSGNRWFNITGRKPPRTSPAPADVHRVIRAAREEQWRTWRSLGALHPDDSRLRTVELAKIDFDLQYAALTAQLHADGPLPEVTLSATQQGVAVRDSFRRALSARTVLPPRDDAAAVEAIRHFKDRATNQDALKAFLTDAHSLAVVTGPPLMGKTELVRYVLATFHHGRSPVMIDIQVTSSVWNLAESLFSALNYHIPADILVSLRDIAFSDVAATLQDFAAAHAAELIIVFDHVERLLEPSGAIGDPEIREFIGILASQPGAKIILTSRRAIALPSELARYLDPRPQPPVARFPQGPPHVTNVLGTFIGRTEYPPELLAAIDRHPLLTVLAALYLRRVGFDNWNDEAFLSELRANMRTTLFARIVDDRARLAVESISRLRIPVPRRMVVSMAGQDSLAAAEELGLIYEHFEVARRDLVSCIGALRLRTYVDAPDDSGEGEFPEFELVNNESEQVVHARIADEFELLYRNDLDPRWLREMYYHRVLAGDRQSLDAFGKNYRSEVYAAGEYWFLRRKDFKSALWAFRLAQQLGENSTHLRMRIAACLVRSGSAAEGEALFGVLLKEHPSADGIRGSLIDSLLYVRRFPAALARLQEFGYGVTDSVWIAGQYGRAFLGLQRHREAIEAFNYQLSVAPDAVVYLGLARANHRLGATDREQRLLEDALRRHPFNKRLQLAYSSLLERVGRVDEAVRRLQDLHATAPHDGWIVFPLIKALCRQGNLAKARELWHDTQYRIDPDRLRHSIDAELATREERFEAALNALRRIPEQDEHSIGQKLEVYYAWAASAPLELRREIAARGLTEPIEPMFLKNVPVLVSRAKLAVIATDLPSLDEVISQLEVINPQLLELERLRVARSAVARGLPLSNDYYAASG